MADKIPKPLRILMTADTVGGVWTYAIELLKSLERYKVEVALATMGGHLSLRQRQQVAALPQVTLYESMYQLEWMENPWQEVKRAGEWLLQLNQEFAPDLIHLNNFAHGHLKWGRPVVMIFHSCVCSWWQAVKGIAAPPEWQQYRQIVRAGLRAADLVVAPSTAILQAARELYGPFRQVRVIYNGHNSSLFHFKQKEPFIFSMGRVWDEAKNIRMIAQVAADLNWPVYIAGDATHPVTGETLLLPNVHFLGSLSQAEVVDWLSRAALFVLPAKYEPFGLAVLEAALSGCALIVGDIPSLREIWQQAATYVNPQQAPALQATVTRLMDDEFIRNIMGFRAMQRGLLYSSKQTGFEYYRAYRQLLPPVFSEPVKENLIQLN
jgi:glycosyltransferase involved in cell wall biosynthesis